MFEKTGLRQVPLKSEKVKVKNQFLFVIDGKMENSKCVPSGLELNSFWFRLECNVIRTVGV